MGRRLALGLNLPFHQQAFSSEELEAAEEQREKESTISRVFRSMSGSSDGGLDVGDVTAGQRDDYELVMENNGIVQEEAGAGGVINGRNATVILADRPDTLHVRLDGPVQERIARAPKATGIDAERAASVSAARTSSPPRCRSISSGGTLARTPPGHPLIEPPIAPPHR